MNYYPFHIGDYAAHTGHLEPLEDLAYRRMLDLYYVRECALPESPEEIARLIRMKGNVDEIKAVLREFFTNNDGDGWIHMRCEEEIRRMQDKQAKARESAKASHSARRANAERTHSERNSERKPNAEQTHSESLATNTNTNTTIAPKVHRGRGTRLPDDWEPLGEGREFALSQGIGGQAFHDEAAKFADYWRAQPGQKGVKTDWPATWRNWVRKAAEKRPGSFRERDAEAAAQRVREMTGGVLDNRRGDVLDGLTRIA